LALEEYDDFGRCGDFTTGAISRIQLFAVVDYDGKPVTLETGIGFGMTPASDNLVLKLILSRDLN